MQSKAQDVGRRRGIHEGGTNAVGEGACLFIYAVFRGRSGLQSVHAWTSCAVLRTSARRRRSDRLRGP